MGTYDTRGGSPISPDLNEPTELEMAFDTARRYEVTVRFGESELSTPSGLFVPCNSNNGVNVADAFVELMGLVEDMENATDDR